MKLNVGVFGCGPAGLSVSLMLHRLGHRVTMFDRFATPKPTGSGLILQPVGLKVLEHLQIDQRLLGLGAKLDALVGIAVPSGRIALNVHYRHLGDRKFGLGIHRAALFDALHDLVVQEKIEIVPNTVIASSTDCRQFDLVVDALGSRSPLIEQTEHGLRRKKLAFGALWTNVRLPQAQFQHNRLEQRYVGAHKMIGVLPIGKLNANGDALAAFFYSMKEDEFNTNFELDRWKDDVRRIWPETSVLLDQVRTY